MSSLNKQKLGDISDSCLGKMLDKEKNKGSFQPYLANFNVRWGEFELKNLQKMRFEDHEHERYGLKYGDLIICEGGEPGRCAIWRDEVPGIKIQKALHRLRVTPMYSNEFIYYRMLLAGKTGELNRYFIGSTIKHLTGIGLKQVEFEFPDFSVQNKIALVLRTIDKKIELNNRINAELEGMTKTLYDYWFVQFDFPDVNDKPYKTAGGKMVYNPSLKREIPVGWSNAVIGEVLAKVPNTSKVPNKEILDSGAYPVVDQSMDYICGFTNSPSSLLKVSTPHIVFGDHTRIVKFINFDYARGADGTQVLISNKGELPEHLLFQMVKDIDLSSYGYARHFKFLKGSKIILPKVEVSLKYEAIATSIYRKIRSGIFENQELEKLRDWLLPMLMNGQVTVKNNEG